MNITKNPEYNSLISVLIIAIFIGVGYLVFHSAGNPDNAQQGSVFQGAKKDFVQNNTSSTYKHIIVWGNTGTCTVVYDNGTYADGVPQYNAAGDFTGCLLGNGTLIEPGAVGVQDIIIDTLSAKGVTIEQLQIVLEAQGFLNSNDATGTINTATATALKHYQTTHNLSQSGTLDTGTTQTLVGTMIYSKQ